MNKNVTKIIILFLIFSYAISVLVISIKEMYVSQREEKILNEVQEEISSIETEEVQVFEDGAIGIIKIPSLEIEAPIYEGTSQEVLKYSVGHFIGTSLWERKYCTCIT